MTRMFWPSTKWSLISMLGLLTLAAVIAAIYRSHYIMPVHRLSIAEQALANDLTAAHIVFHEGGCLFAMRTNPAETLTFGTARRLGEAEAIACLRITSFPVPDGLTLDHPPLPLAAEVIAELRRHFNDVQHKGGFLTCRRSSATNCSCAGDDRAILSVPGPKP